MQTKHSHLTSTVTKQIASGSQRLQKYVCANIELFTATGDLNKFLQTA